MSKYMVFAVEVHCILYRIPMWILRNTFRELPYDKEHIQQWIDETKADQGCHDIIHNILNIRRRVLRTDDMFCLFCHEKHFKMLLLPCKHCICIEAYNFCEEHKMECFLCKSPFKWSDCSVTVAYQFTPRTVIFYILLPLLTSSSLLYFTYSLLFR